MLLGTGFRAGFATDPEVKVAVLRIHLPVVGVVMLLTLGRLIWWWRFDRKPNPIKGVPPWQQSTARWTHRALYAGILLLLASGVALSILSRLPDALFGNAVFPELEKLPPRSAHGIGARLMAGLALLHAGAALCHHWVMKDRMLKRMWFRKT